MKRPINNISIRSPLENLFYAIFTINVESSCSLFGYTLINLAQCNKLLHHILSLVIYPLNSIYNLTPNQLADELKKMSKTKLQFTVGSMRTFDLNWNHIFCSYIVNFIICKNCKDIVPCHNQLNSLRILLDISKFSGYNINFYNFKLYPTFDKLFKIISEPINCNSVISSEISITFENKEVPVFFDPNDDSHFSKEIRKSKYYSEIEKTYYKVKSIQDGNTQLPASNKVLSSILFSKLSKKITDINITEESTHNDAISKILKNERFSVEDILHADYCKACEDLDCVHNKSLGVNYLYIMYSKFRKENGQDYYQQIKTILEEIFSNINGDLKFILLNSLVNLLGYILETQACSNFIVYIKKKMLELERHPIPLFIRFKDRIGFKLISETVAINIMDKNKFNLYTTKHPLLKNSELPTKISFNDFWKKIPSDGILYRDIFDFNSKDIISFFGTKLEDYIDPEYMNQNCYNWILRLANK